MRLFIYKKNYNHSSVPYSAQKFEIFPPGYKWPESVPIDIKSYGLASSLLEHLHVVIRTTALL